MIPNTFYYYPKLFVNKKPVQTVFGFQELLKVIKLISNQKFDAK